MGTANRVAKNTLILYARMGITMFISLYSTRLILAALGAEDFGIFNVVGGAVSMLVFLNSAMAAASQRFMSYAQGEGDEEKQKKIFNASVVMHLVIGIILVVVLELGGLVLFNGVLKIDPERMAVAKLIYHFLVISTFVKVISVPYDAVINARENMLFVAVLGIFEAIVKLAIALYVTYTNLDRLASYGFLMAGMTIILLLITRIYCHKKYSEVTIQPIKYFDKALLKEMSNFGGWSFLGASGSMIGNYGKGIVLNMFFGAVLNAAAGVAMQLSAQLSVFSNVMLKALNPVIVKAEGSGKRRKMIQTSLTGIKISFFLQAILFIPAFIEMDFIQHIWLKEPPEYSILFCKLMLILNLTDQLGITLPSAIGAVGNIKWLQVLNSVLNLLPLGLNYFFFTLGFPPQTSLYIAIAFAFFKVVIYVILSKNICDLSITFYFKDIILRCFIICFFVASITILPFVFFPQGFIRLTTTFLVGAMLFLIVAYNWGFNQDERIIIRGIFLTAKQNVFNIATKKIK